jgi:hypothetical protein
MPLCFVFDDFFKQTTTLFWICDGFWLAGIVTKFVTADNCNRTLAEISKRYLTSGDFFIDCLHTLPSIITYQDDIYMFFPKFLRLKYFNSMFSIFDQLLYKYFATYSENQI